MCGNKQQFYNLEAHKNMDRSATTPAESGGFNVVAGQEWVLLLWRIGLCPHYSTFTYLNSKTIINNCVTLQKLTQCTWNRLITMLHFKSSKLRFLCR